MKFIFATDLHIMGSSPSSRKDDYTEALSRKIEEVFLIADEKQVDFILLGGDLFETYNVSTSVIRQTLGWFKNKSIPIFSILGNHDLYGHTLKTFNRSAMSILDITDFVQILDVDSQKSLRGIHYYNGLEGDLCKYNEPSEEMQEHLQGEEFIWVIHGMISNTGLPHISRNITIEDVRVGPKTKLVLTGDYHAGFPVVTREDGVIFANPGALSRRTMGKENLYREIQIAVIDYDPEDFNVDIDINYVSLKSAAPPEEIFDLQEINETKVRKREIFSYIEKLKNLEIESSLGNLELELEEFAQKVTLDAEVLQAIKDRLQKKQTDQEVNL